MASGELRSTRSTRVAGTEDSEFHTEYQDFEQLSVHAQAGGIRRGFCRDAQGTGMQAEMGRFWKGCPGIERVSGRRWKRNLAGIR